MRLLFLSLLFTTNLCFGQKQRCWYFEAGGSGGFGSLNYEKQFKEAQGLDFRWSAGFSYTPIDKNNGGGLIFPLLVKGLIGEGKHKAEIGIGQGLTITTKGSPFVMGLAVAGYRYNDPDKKVFYKLAYTPLISYLADRQVQHWGGASIGWILKERNAKKKQKKERYNPAY